MISEERMGKLIDALIVVESNGNDKAVGDNGAALGCLQIHQGVIADVNRDAKTPYIHGDAFDRNKARTICKAYLTHYGASFEHDGHDGHDGHEANEEILARIHNGGPKGYLKDATIPYWNKVKAVLGSIEQQNPQLASVESIQEPVKAKRKFYVAYKASGTLIGYVGVGCSGTTEVEGGSICEMTGLLDSELVRIRTELASILTNQKNHGEVKPNNVFFTFITELEG